MALHSKLDSPLYLLYGKSKPKPGDLGIELELEGSLAEPEGVPWQYKAEGSLRGGGEYVLKNPVTLANLDNTLVSLQKLLDSGKPKISIRCSTHVHVNVMDKSARQTYQAVLAYYLLEPLLTGSQPQKRRGNLFCLRMQDAEAITNDVSVDMEADLPFTTFTKERNRYSALNLVAVGKFGSLEFRFLDAFTNTEIIKAWSKLFYNLVNRGSDISPMSLLKIYDELSPQDFVETLLGPESLLVTKGLSPAAINAAIHLNYDSVFELAHKLNTKKFEMPRHLWNEDLVESDEDGNSVSFNTPQWVGAQISPTFAHLTPAGTLSPALQAAYDQMIQMTTNTPPPPTTSPHVWGGPSPIPAAPQPAHLIIDDPDEPNEDAWDAFPDPFAFENEDDPEL